MRSLFTEGLITASEFKEDIEKINVKFDEYKLRLTELMDAEGDDCIKPSSISKEEIRAFLFDFSRVISSNIESERMNVKELIRLLVKEITVHSKSEKGIIISINYQEMAAKILSGTPQEFEKSTTEELKSLP